MARRKNDTRDFAVWFARTIAKIEINYTSREFKKLLGQASRLRKDGYDLKTVRLVINAMQARGMKISTPYCVTWQSPDRKTTWYEFARPRQPPMWDGLGMHLLESGKIPAKFN